MWTKKKKRGGMGEKKRKRCSCYDNRAQNISDAQCCPAGWSEADNLCLAYHSGPESWDEASSTCSSLQGHLVEVKDTADNSAVVSFRWVWCQFVDRV